MLVPNFQLTSRHLPPKKFVWQMHLQKCTWLNFQSKL